MKEECLIITGGSLDLDWAREWINDRHFNYVIAVDSGLDYADRLGLKIDCVLGDYDSVKAGLLNRYNKDTRVETYPCEKDFTDTHLAIITALKYGASCIYILGAIGSRMDHTFTNICNMKAAYDADVECYIIDRYNRIRIAGEYGGKVLIEKNMQYGDYISILPLTEPVIITLSGVKYPLDKYILHEGASVCQSNEIIGDVAVIDISEGIAVLFETRD